VIILPGVPVTVKLTGVPAHVVVPPVIEIPVGIGLIVIVATLVSSEHGTLAFTVYIKEEVDAPIAGVKVPAPALNVPPEPDTLVHTPPACSPVIRLNRLIEGLP
jgi:hypothetical protein